METAAQHSSYDEQDQLLRDYCREAEGLITLAHSRDDATRIKEGQCQRFRQECKRTMIVNAAATYLEQIIERQWGAGGTDRTHDNH